MGLIENTLALRDVLEAVRALPQAGRMISILHLLWIVPTAAAIGFLGAAFFIGAKCE